MRQLCYSIMLFLVCQELFLILQNFSTSVLFNSFLILSHLFCFVKNFFLSFFERNGEGGIWTLAPLLTTYSLSRGAPSASLGTSPNCPTQSLLFSEAFYIISRCFLFVKNFFNFSKVFYSLQIAERVGFEPTRPCGQTVFKTASLWPLRYLSIYCCLSLVFSHRRRKWYSSTKVFTCQQLFYIFFIFSFSDFNKPWNPA